MQHNFDTQVAQKYGVNCAVILNNIFFWIEKNKANDKNYCDGDYWTYNSIKAFTELFPYMSEKQISVAINKLISEDIIKKGNYNKDKYDHTLWYALTQKGKSIMLIGKIDSPEKENGSSQNVKSSYTDNKPYSKPNKKQNIDIFDSYTSDINLLKALKEFEEMRKKIKAPLKETAKDRLLKSLNSIASDNTDKITILNKSTDNCWKGIFPLKAEDRKEVISYGTEL